MKWLIVIVTLFGGALVLQANWFRQTKSITYDESFYLSCALRTLQSGRLDPRLASNGVAPLPVMLAHLAPLSLGQREREEPDLSRRIFQSARLIGGPRLATAILIGLPLVLTVAVWLYRRKGILAAATGAGLVAFSPSIIAHASLAATDACFALFVLLALAAIAWYFSRPSWLRFLVMAAGIAAAMAAKYSGVFLLPVAAILFVLHTFRPAEENRRPSWLRGSWRIARDGALLVLLVFPIWWGLHLFALSVPPKYAPPMALPDWPAGVPIPCPAPMDGITYQYLHNRVGHCAFLMGDRSNTGWWHFFPLAMLLKSTPIELLLVTGLLLFLLASLRSLRQTLGSLDIDLQVLGLAAAVFGLMLVTSRINIGHRYLLPLYPLLIIAGVDRLWDKIGTASGRSGLPSGTSPRIDGPADVDAPETRRSGSPGGPALHRSRSAGGTYSKALACIAGLLLAGQAASCLSTGPHYLAYFNRLPGGPERGWHYLVDSSIDWGQDLPALSRELKRLGFRRVALEYFGTAGPRAYGVEADPLSNLRRPPEEYEAVAVSVTCLQGLYTKSGDPFRELRRVPPVASAGYSILIYDLSELRAQQAFLAAVWNFRQNGT